MLFTMKCFQVLSVFLCFLALFSRGFATLFDDNNNSKNHRQQALSLRAGSSSYSLGLQSNRKQSAATTSTTTTNQSPIGNSAISSLSTGRRACWLYVWDFPSAVFYRWCHHLLKDCVYEGRGGHKFVRIEPGSMLQLLYPCSRYSPDRCILCGGAFRDHLELWWSKNLYNSFDMVVEKVFREGVYVQKEQVIKSKERKGAVVIVRPEEVDYVYHRRYVIDLGEKLQGVDNPKEKRKILKKLAVENPLLSGRVEKRKVQLGREKREYVVPASTASTSKPSVSFIFIRAVLLRALDSLIEVELFEKHKKEASR